MVRGCQLVDDELGRRAATNRIEIGSSGSRGHAVVRVGSKDLLVRRHIDVDLLGEYHFSKPFSKSQPHQFAVCDERIVNLLYSAVRPSVDVPLELGDADLAALDPLVDEGF